MNIEQVVKKYADFYASKNSSRIADLILEAEDVELSHRTLRRKIGEYRNSQRTTEAPCCEDPSLCVSLKCAVNTPQVAIPIWKGQDTVRYFQKQVEEVTPTSYLQPYLTGDINNVLVIGDPHEPFCLEGYMEHCLEQQKRFNCGTVICIGDIVDNHYSSFHDADPDGKGAGDELAATIKKTKEWHRVFPNAICTIGNHDAIIMRKAFSSGVSKRWIKGLSEVLEMPTWKFVESYEHNGILYTHTLGGNLLIAAMARRQSTICGHLHTKAEIQWNVSKFDRIFSMQVGCGIDDKAYAFVYAKLVARKSIISCGVVLGDIPLIAPMNL
jgi:hypothetical protein